MQHLMQAIGVGLTFDRERRGRTRDDEVAGFGDAFTRLMRYRQTSALDEPQHRDVGSVFTDMRPVAPEERSEEHTSELQSLMRIPYAVFCLKKKNNTKLNSRPLVHK